MRRKNQERTENWDDAAGSVPEKRPARLRPAGTQWEADDAQDDGDDRIPEGMHGYGAFGTHAGKADREDQH